MKKTIVLIALVLGCLIACEKNPVGSTATKDIAGQWYVTYDGVDADGNVTMADPFGIGHTLLLTYNTAGNYADTLWLDDQGNFWDYKVKIPVVGGKSFGSPTDTLKLIDQSNGILVKIWNGEILPGAATTPSGMPADSIHFELLFSDDTYAGTYWDHLTVGGFRYTGFTNDD